MNVLATLLIATSLLALGYTAPTHHQSREDFLRLLDTISGKQLNKANVNKVSAQDFGTQRASAATEDKSFADLISLINDLSENSGGTLEISPELFAGIPEATAEDFNIMKLVQLLLKIFSMFNRSGGNMGDGGDGDSTSNTGLLGALGNLFG